jgi:sterol-4alpha-carboxylate 3-dehydrogenase (decarboxylating)
VHDLHHPLQAADETLPMLYRPKQPDHYSLTKSIAEVVVLSAKSNASGLLTVALRPASMYGQSGTTQILNLVKSTKAGQASMRIGPESSNFDNIYVLSLTHAQMITAKALLAAAGAHPPTQQKPRQGQRLFRHQ